MSPEAWRHEAPIRDAATPARLRDSARAGATEGESTDPVERSIFRVLQRYERALEAGNPAAVVALYSAEPALMPQNAPAIEGRDAVRHAYEQVFAESALTVRLEVYEVEVLGEQAWARTSSTARTTVLSSGEVTETSIYELFVLRREGRPWRIHRRMSAADQP